MQSIVKTDYDSQFCGNVPLNFVNTIQPYGVLMVIEKNTMLIKQVSENTAEFLNFKPEELLNTIFYNLVSANEKEELKKAFEENYQDPHFDITFTLQNSLTSFIANIHIYDKQFVAEIEPILKHSGFFHVYNGIKHILSGLQKSMSTEEVCSVVARQLKNFSGFDKVMIYQFDENWNGLVIAEEMENEMDSYLGLYFPASDIPKQARSLYLNNPYRLIPDAGKEAVKLTPVLNPLTFTFTDLSSCNLRSVPAVHVEYLANMKVSCSMSTPVIKDNKLWGLISCHHKKPKLLSYDTRSAFVLVSSMFSSELSSREKERQLRHDAQAVFIQSEISRKFAASGSLEQILNSAKDNIYDLLEINGFTFIYKDAVISSGQVLSDDYLEEFIFWLKINKSEEVVGLDSVPFNTGSNYSNQPCGFIIIPLNIVKGYYLIGYRPERKHTIHWGGNPNDAIKFEDDKKTYHPRNSFAHWQETISNTSAKWEHHTVQSAVKLQLYISDHLEKRKEYLS